MKSMTDLSIHKELEGAKLRVSTMLKKRKKMSNMIKAYELDRLGQMFKMEAKPPGFTVSGSKINRSKT